LKELKERRSGGETVLDEKALRSKLASILQRPRYSTLATGRREQLIDEFVNAARNSDTEETEGAEEGQDVPMWD
jgi:hypothetical protein